MQAADLAGDWFRSHEEEQEGRIVYRSAAYDFPRARAPRSSMRLHPDGSAEFGEGGPADRPEMAAGRWHVEGDVLTLAGPSRDDTYRIDQLGDGILVLTPG